jgi:hypothetical protein
MTDNWSTDVFVVVRAERMNVSQTLKAAWGFGLGFDASGTEEIEVSYPVRVIMF